MQVESRVETGEAPKFKCPTENGETDTPLVASLCGRCQTQIQTQRGFSALDLASQPLFLDNGAGDRCIMPFIIYTEMARRRSSGRNVREGPIVKFGL